MSKKKVEEEDFLATKPKPVSEEEDFMAMKPKTADKPWLNKKVVKEPEEEDFMAAKPKAADKPWLNKKVAKETEEEKPADKPWLNKKKSSIGQPKEEESPVKEKKAFKINKASEEMIQNAALINMGAVNN